MKNEKFCLAARINVAAYLLDGQTPIDMILLHHIPRQLLRDCWQDLKCGINLDLDYWEEIDGWESSLIVKAIAIAKRQIAAHFQTRQTSSL